MAATKSIVTGANGFVGAHLVDALVARGDQVSAMDVGEAPPRDDVAYLQSDVRDADAMRALCKGADVVFHNASIVHTRNSKRDHVFDVNVGGSSNILDACHQGGVPRLVYVSSASAVYEGRDIENGDESLPYSSVSQAPYADSKIEAEKLVLASNGDSGTATCSVRPHVIYGPGDRRFLPALLARAKAGKLKYGVGRDPKLSDFTYVSNLVDALLLADDKLADSDSGVAGEAYFVTNGEPTEFFDFVGRVLSKLELPPIRGMAPYWLAYSVAAIVEAFDTLRGGTLDSEDGMSRFAIRYMCTHHYFSIDKARRELGYEPRVSIDEGIELTCRHLLDSGALDQPAG